MSRYFLNDLIGQGTDEDSYRPSIFDYPLANAQAEVPSYPQGHPQWGQPMHTWALVELKAGYDPAMAADPRIDALPDCPLDTLVPQMDATQVASLAAALERRNIGLSLGPAETLGTIIAAIKRRAGEAPVVPTIATLDL